MKKKLTVKEIALIGVLGGLAGILMLFDFPLPFAPGFLKFDVSDIPGLFAGFFLSPLCGCLVSVVKIILNLIFNGTSTAFVGEASNLFGSCFFIFIAASIYHKNKSKKSALVGMLISAVATSVMYIFMNAFITFPMYGKLYGMSMEKIVAAGSKVNPLVHDMITMMIFAVLPFNLVKYLICSAVTEVTYKKCSNALKSILNK